MKMKIKNTLLITLAIICLLTAISLSGAASVYTYEWINVDMISQTPDPVTPGDVVDVRIKAENYGSNAVTDFQLEMLQEYPFSLYDENDKVKTLTSLSSGDDFGVHFKYKIRINEDAVEGVNYIRFRYKFFGGDWITINFPINIQSSDAVVLIQEVKTIPETISHGEKAVINFKLKNIADSLIKDISVDLNIESSLIPISPLNSGTKKKLKSLKPSEEKDVSFDIITLATAESNIYKVPVTLTYFDEVGTKYNRSDVVSIIISSKPDISYVIENSEILMSGTSGKITVKMINKGSEDIKFVNMRLGSSDNFVQLSNDKVYVGNIDSDDYETVDFDLYVKSGAVDLVLPLFVEYRDSINKEFKDDINLPVKLYTAKDAKTYNLIPSNGYAGWFVLLIIVVGGFLIYRKYKKSKKK